MKELSDRTRNSLAQDIRDSRKFEKENLMTSESREKRDRSASRYISYFQGLESTLAYTRRLPNKTLVDLGAGTSRAIAEIARSDYGKDITFIGTGLVSDPAIEENIGRAQYRITPAETMRGFEDASVGCFISLYGPFLYSSHLDLILKKMDELLIPDGIVKICIGLRLQDEKEPRRHEVNERNANIARSIEVFLREKKYGVDFRDDELIDQKRVNRIFLAIKPGFANPDTDTVAHRIMTEDIQSRDAMREQFLKAPY